MGSQGSQNHTPGDQDGAPLQFSLQNILSGDAENSEYTVPKEELEQDSDEEGPDREVASGYCIECEGTYSRLSISTYRFESSTDRPTRPAPLREL